MFGKEALFPGIRCSEYRRIRAERPRIQRERTNQ